MAEAGTGVVRGGVASGSCQKGVLMNGAGGVAWRPGEGGWGGVGEMGTCAGPFVLCNNGC